MAPQVCHSHSHLPARACVTVPGHWNDWCFFIIQFLPQKPLPLFKQASRIPSLLTCSYFLQNACHYLKWPCLFAVSPTIVSISMLENRACFVSLTVKPSKEQALDVWPHFVNEETEAEGYLTTGPMSHRSKAKARAGTCIWPIPYPMSLACYPILLHVQF